MIIGISGKAQSGKDSTGNILQNLYKGKSFTDGVGWIRNGEIQERFTVRKFAAKLKDSIQFKFPNHFNTSMWESGDTEYREGFLEFLGMTRRELLIAEAMALRAVNKNYWVESLMQEYRDDSNRKVSDNLQYHHSKWIITDLRFENEVEAISKRKGVTIRVERPGIKLINSSSETSLDKYPDFDYIIYNEGTYLDLIGKVEEIHNLIQNRNN